MAKWTREKIIREILNREASGMSLSLGSIKKSPENSLYQAGTRIFGSWRNALKASGISPERARKPSRWSPSKVLAKIRSLSQRKKKLQSGELSQRYTQLTDAARHHFGSWPRAMIAAGVDPEKMRIVKPWTEERVIEEILTHALNHTSMNDRTLIPKTLINAGIRFFGSWQAALSAAGIKPNNTCQKEVSPAQDNASNSTPANPLLETDVRIVIPNTKGLSMSNSTRSDKPQCPRLPGTRWSEEDILEAIRARVRDNKQMNPSAVDEDDSPLYRVARRRYGSWWSALLVAGLNPNTFRVKAIHK